MTKIVTALATLALVAAGASAALAAPAATQSVSLVVKSDVEHGKKGSDGKWHDAFLPGDFTVHAGSRVLVTVRNYDTAAHTFTAPALNLNVRIKAGSATHPSTTTFRFTPSKRGSYVWHCMANCDAWAMTHDGFMTGRVTVG